MDKSRRFNTWYWVAAIVGILLIQYLIGTAQQDADKVAALTPGFTGADLANLVNEAALLATRRGATR